MIHFFIARYSHRLFECPPSSQRFFREKISRVSLKFVTFEFGGFMKVQSPRGTQDFLPEKAEIMRFIENKSHDWAIRFGYGEIITPIFEFTEIFHRTMGETSDVIHK